MASKQLITFELDAIVGALTLANNALKRVQTQLPAGPPFVKDEITALKVVADLSTQLQTLSTTWLGGGTKETKSVSP